MMEKPRRQVVPRCQPIAQGLPPVVPAIISIAAKYISLPTQATREWR
jgi:hypothetical protein